MKLQPKPGVKFSSPTDRRRRALAALLQSKEEGERVAAEVLAEDDQRLQLLAIHYGIEQGPWMYRSLALVLAHELYPEPKRKGRPSKWTQWNMGALVVEIERLVRPRDSSHGIAWAATQLSAREPWKSFLSVRESGAGSDPAEALRKVYYDFRGENWATVMRDSFRSHKKTKSLNEWDAFVTSLVKKPQPE